MFDNLDQKKPQVRARRPSRRTRTAKPSILADKQARRHHDEKPHQGLRLRGVFELFHLL